MGKKKTNKRPPRGLPWPTALTRWERDHARGIAGESLSGVTPPPGLAAKTRRGGRLTTRRLIGLQ